MSTPTILSRIIEHKRTELEARQARLSLAEIQDRMAEASQPRGFSAALQSSVAAGRAAVIAEIKKASPSKGVIRADFDPVAIARSYAAAGASCLSVLTDERFFQGHDDYLRAVRAAVDLPVLRKDFLIDPYQVYESRLIGADCVLLIVAVLAQAELEDLYGMARSVGLDVLIEVHDGEELGRALTLQPELIGINNRNLHTFDTTLDTTYQLLPAIPEGTLVVTESGIHSAEQVAQMRAHNVHSFLVGEAFMRQADPGAALQALFTTGRTGPDLLR